MSSGLELGPLTAPPDLGGLDQEERVAAMRDWFFDNFEDPAEHTPHDSGEGSYQFRLRVVWSSVSSDPRVA